MNRVTDFCMTHCKISEKCCNKFFLERPKNRFHEIFEGEELKTARQIFRRVCREEDPPNATHIYAYTCEWFDKKTGKCKHHEDRLGVCRDFLCDDAQKFYSHNGE